MAKTNQIKKVVNGEIADADDINQIVENAGAEGGLIPYSDDNQQRTANGSESIGATAYPWGSFFGNRDADFNEIDPSTNTLASSVTLSNLRKFISQKDTPNVYTGEGDKFVAVKTDESGLKFVTSPNKSNVIFTWSGVESVSQAAAGWGLVSSGTDNTPATAACEVEVLVSASTSFKTLKRFRFTKIPGITTITIHTRLYKGTGGEGDAFLNVDIGGQSGTVQSGDVTTPTWYEGGTPIDVSGLSDGTDYEGIIQLKTEDTNNELAYCTAVTLIAS